MVNNTISDEEIRQRELLQEIENKDKKEDQLRRMAWVAMLSVVAFTGLLFSPYVSIERIDVLSDVLQMLYITQAGVIATFFGTNAYLNKK
jgi:translation initiation factor 6 (eIF-6)